LNVSLIVNPVSGKRALRSLSRIESLLRDKVVLNTFITRKKGDASVFSSALSGTDRVIIAGGDGTFNEVINGMLTPGKDLTERRSIPLAIIPLGTANVLAGELGIPVDIESAVQIALTGTVKKISLGRINGHFFSLMAGIGYDGETVHRFSLGVKRVFGKGAYVLSGIQTLTGYNPSLILLKTQKETFTGFSAVIGNACRYGGNYQVTPKADITASQLDLCLLKSKTRKKLIRFIKGVILNNHLELDDVIYRKISKLEITSRDTVHVQVDGDYFGTLPVTIEVAKDSIEFVC
jgi:diacylglycerol kinase (ATP)